MSDTVSQKRRSEITSHIKSKNTNIELLVRKELHSLGYRFRVNHIPQSRQEYWNNKIFKTKQRDEAHIKDLSDNGWQVIIIWECEIKTKFEETIDNLINIIGNQ